MPARSHVFVAKALGATAWFWMMYRIRSVGSLIHRLETMC
jgi:hypothetical protein